VLIWRQANESNHVLAMTTLYHASRIMFDVISTCTTTIVINEMS